jgi:hypothetical protein
LPPAPELLDDALALLLDDALALLLDAPPEPLLVAPLEPPDPPLFPQARSVAAVKAQRARDTLVEVG